MLTTGLGLMAFCASALILVIWDRMNHPTGAGNAMGPSVLMTGYVIGLGLFIVGIIIAFI